MDLGANVPAFLGKLWKLVEDPETDDLICWAPNGRSFFIRNQAQFARELLPHYYKHNNMASFVRQLNMYGFHKIVSVELGGLKCDKDEMEFAHQYFVQGHPYLLENIKRKIASNRDPTHALYKPELMNKMLTEVRSMRGRQEHLDTRLGAMKRENEALWRELAVLRQKHMKQQQIVNKLIHFLVTLVQPTRGGGLSVKRRYPLMIDDSKRHKQPKIPKMQNAAKGPVIHELNGSEHELENQYMEMLEDPMIQSPEQPSPVSDDVEGVNFEEEILPSDSLEAPHQNNGTKKLAKGKKKVIETSFNVSPEPSAVLDEVIEGINEEQLEPKKKVKGKKKRKNNAPIKIHIPSTSGDEDEREDNVVFKVETDLGSATVEAVKPRLAKPVPMATVRSSKLAAMAANLNKSTEQSTQEEPEVEFDLDENTSKEDPKGFFNLELDDMLVAEPSTGATSYNTEASTSSVPNDLSLSCINTPVGRLESAEEMDGHLDTVQSELDNLRDVLRNEGCSIDATTLLGLFGPDDPMSFGIPLEPDLDPSYCEDNYASVGGDSQNKLGGGKLIAYNSGNATLTDLDSEMLMTPQMSESELNSDYCLEVDNLDKEDSKASFFNSLLSLDEESKKN